MAKNQRKHVRTAINHRGFVGKTCANKSVWGPKRFSGSRKAFLGAEFPHNSLTDRVQ